jgi:type II secretory pathway component PulC
MMDMASLAVHTIAATTKAATTNQMIFLFIRRSPFRDGTTTFTYNIRSGKSPSCLTTVAAYPHPTRATASAR